MDIERDGAVQLRRLPVSSQEIATLAARVDELAPVQGIVEVAARLCAIAERLGSRLGSIEINPLVTCADGAAGVLALDALGTVAAELSESSSPTADPELAASPEAVDAHV